MRNYAKPEISLESLGAGIEPPVNRPSSHYSTGVSTSVEERAIVLLGAGISSEAVASAIGVTPSRVSQLLSGKDFADRVSALLYENLQKHNARDNKYDSMEDVLLTKLEKSMPFLIRPESILKAISVVNSAKRRGQASPEQVTNNNNIVNLVLPSIIAEKYAISINNQVISAGGQDLLTMQSSNLLKQVEEEEQKRAVSNTELNPQKQLTNQSKPNGEKDVHLIQNKRVNL